MTDKQAADSTAQAARPGLNKYLRFLRILGIASIRGRYLYVAAFITVFLFGAAWIADIQLNKTTTEGFANTIEQRYVKNLLNLIADDVWYSETALQGYMRIPDKTRNKAFHFNIDQAQKRIAILLEYDWINNNPNIKGNIRKLSKSLQQLRANGERAIHIRTDTEKLFPAMPIMVYDMLPANADFISHSTLAIDESRQSLNKPHQLALYQLFSDTRYAWARMISAFRNVISNRFGIFGNEIRGMAAQEKNIKLYSERISNNLNKIGLIRKKHGLEFDQEGAFKQMLVSHKKWLAAFKQTKKIIYSSAWRTDIPLMKNLVEPSFRQVWQDIQILQNDLAMSASRDVTALTRTGGSLINAIWTIAVIGFVIIVIGYLFFEFSIRRPIYGVARALKAEAQGETVNIQITGNTVETQDLIDAFSHMREQVNSRQERLEAILDNAAEGIITFDEQGIIESINHAAEHLFGYAEIDVIGEDIGLIIPPDNKFDRRKGYIKHFMRSEIKRLIGHEGEVTGKHKDGSRFPMALKVSAMTLDGKRMYTGLVADISERKAMLEHLREMAEHDGLTGLYNRTYFQTELERVVERVRRDTKEKYAILYIDLDNFKFINDTEGHAAGDMLLIEVAQILKRRTRKSDLVARFGGDEFTVLLHNVDEERVEYIAESFRSQLANSSFHHGGKLIDIGCSIGAAMIKGTGTPEEALSHADFACHLAKTRGRNRVHVFNHRDEENVTSMSVDMGWSRRIKEAIERNLFTLACQPIVVTKNKEIFAYEVLIRMIDDNNELIMPNGFLPSAERFGLSVDIDKWVIANAIDTLVEQRRHIAGLKYTINLSAQSIGDASVYRLIKDKLQTTGLPANALCFEVTESVAIADMKQAEIFLSELQKIGCTTALDDFGSGFSSFAYLQDLPVDYVKIDGRFVKNLADNHVDQAIVRAMNEVAQALGKQTIAEFVENEGSLKVLAEIGVDYAQGYHLGRPDLIMPCDKITENHDNLVCIKPKSA